MARMRIPLVFCLATISSGLASAAALDWPSLETESVKNLQAYLRLDTSNPPGDVRKAVGLLESICKKEGISTKRYVIDEKKGLSSLLARLPGGGKGRPLLMLAHMDVVPANPSEWKLPPFSGIVKEGELWGRGALDMKGPGMSELMAMASLKREGFVPKRDLLLLFNPDEEAGGHHGAQWMVENHWEDLNPEFVLDEGGSGTKGVYTDDGRIIYGISVDEKRVLWLKASAKGQGGHGSMPGQDLAVAKLSKFLAKLSSWRPPQKQNDLVTLLKARVGGHLAENELTRALMGTTVTATSFRAGVGDPPKVNVVPDLAEATIDCRLLPGESWEALLGRINAMAKEFGVLVELIQSPVESPSMGWDSPLFRSMESTIARLEPGALTLPVLCTGGTDARYFRAKGAVGYGFLPFVLTPDQKALWHSRDERIVVEDFRKGIRLYHDVLADFLGR